jgi:membrane associated rhomboid family serine protease
MFIPLYDDNPVHRTPVVTYILIAANVLVFLWSGHLNDLQEQTLVYRRGFVPLRIAQLSDRRPITVPMEEIVQIGFFRKLAVQRPLQLEPDPREIYASLFTCMFLHGSWIHLLGNMWFLYLFGNNVEDRLGALPYLILYLGGGLVASGTHWLFDPRSTIPVIGASGAVAVILGAYTVTWPWARVQTLVILVIFVTFIEVPALIVNGAWFLGQLIAGQEAMRRATAGGVAWWAHVGGFIAGALLMPLFSALFARRDNLPKSFEEGEA